VEQIRELTVLAALKDANSFPRDEVEFQIALSFLLRELQIPRDPGRPLFHICNFGRRTASAYRKVDIVSNVDLETSHVPK
jgi:hypothetical protein